VQSEHSSASYQTHIGTCRRLVQPGLNLTLHIFHTMTSVQSCFAAYRRIRPKTGNKSQFTDL